MIIFSLKHQLSNIKTNIKLIELLNGTARLIGVYDNEQV